ncbi:hypothetical protein ACYULU_04155 [Breznakiellaceae bacterium SP9]
MKINRIMIFVAAFFFLNGIFLFAQNGGNDEGITSDADKPETENPVLQMQEASEANDVRINRLIEEIDDLSRKVQTLIETVPSQKEDISSMYVILLIILFLVVGCVVAFIYLKIRQLGDKVEGNSSSLARIENKIVASHRDSSRSGSALVPPSIRSATPGTSERSNPVHNTTARNPAMTRVPPSEPSPNLPLVKPASSTTAQTESDSISPLYSSQDKRDDRRCSEPNDIFLDIDQDTYSQSIQGEKVQLLFEKKGAYIISPFVCINNALYINFHFFNEKKAITADKEALLSTAFEIVGTLPGKIQKMYSGKNGKDRRQIFCAKPR